MRTFFIISLASLALCSFSQQKSIESFISDSVMLHASVSFCVADANNGEVVTEYNSGKSLIPASVLKLITSAAALELLGSQYIFKTTIGYTGSFNKRSGKLKGDIVIKGGGDPVLGSQYFKDHYQNFQDKWVSEIIKFGIKKIEGRVITDDSYYDFLPVPAKWLWEDAGNYYGAGAFGISVFDNTYEIHFKTSSDSTMLAITQIVPEECRSEFSNWLVAAGTSDEGYVFAAPYSTSGWLAGSIPANMDDFVLKASIADPPSLIAKVINEKLLAEGISVSQEPTTFRLEKIFSHEKPVTITETASPALSEIIEVLNHESVNLFAEHLIKELGKKYRGTGSTISGTEVILDFLNEAEVNTEGMFIEDGSGLSPLDAINARELVKLLVYMKNSGEFFKEYYASLPEAGKEGTLKSYFRDPVFDSRLRAKSGSMTRVRSYAGYITTASDKKLAFAVIVNNFTGPSRDVISGIEEILKEIILDN